MSVLGTATGGGGGFLGPQLGPTPILLPFDRVELAVAAQSITFQNIPAGRAVYRIVLHSQLNAAGQIFRIEPNGINANMSTQSDGAFGGGSQTAFSDSVLMLVRDAGFGPGAGDDVWAEGSLFNIRTARRRVWLAASGLYSVGAGNATRVVLRSAGSWNDAVTQITSITINQNQGATGIAAGTVALLYASLA